MDALSELYHDLLAVELQRKAKSTIASRIRQFVQSLSEQLGERRLSLDATVILANQRGINDKAIDRSYFRKIVERKWTLETDENGFVWIRLDRPR